MKIFITGVNGQLGYDCVKEAISRGHEVIMSGQNPVYTGLEIPGPVPAYIPLDLRMENHVKATLAIIKPDIIINCAAWTDVNAAEEEDNKLVAWDINVSAVRYLAEYAKEYNITLVQISSDYIFYGLNNNKPWVEDDQPFPQNWYGITKSTSEVWAMTLSRHYIIRTSWIFGINGNNFIKKIIEKDKTHSAISVVNDQIGRPSYTIDIAKVIFDLIETNKYGIYNVTNAGSYISWYDLAVEVKKLCKLNFEIKPIQTDITGPVTRPMNSKLSMRLLQKEGISLPPDWHNAVCRYIKELKGLENENR